MIDIETLNECMSYDPQTGELVWKVRPARHFKAERDAVAWNAKFAGKPALSSVNKVLGYRSGSVNNKGMYAHRAAWAIFHGKWPTKQVDHINGDRSDNRISNLRTVTKSGNMRNARRRSDNTSGVMGVSWDAARKQWQARIGRKHIGRFDLKEDAIKARKAAEITHGYHANHGRAA